MDAFEAMAVEEIIKSQIGKNASFWAYDRSLKTPMNLVMSEAENQLSAKFQVYWVNNGLPQNFCLSNFSSTPVIYSVRYLELVYFARQLFVNNLLSNFRKELSERICLKLIAEFALKSGDPEFATLAFLKSVVGQGIFFPDMDILQMLEREPINEAYMATWFFGLVHELGHLQAFSADLWQGGLFSDKGVSDAVEFALDQLSFLPPDLKRSTLAKAKQKLDVYPLGLDHLRSEGIADIFAVSVLFESTRDIMRRIGKDDFKLAQFLMEMNIFQNIIALIERCTQIARFASSRTAISRDVLEDFAVHPAAFVVRSMMITEYLGITLAGLISHPAPPSQEEMDRQKRLVIQINTQFMSAIGDEIDSGLALAMRFALFPQERERNLLGQFRTQIEQDRNLQALIEARQFCNLADSLQTKSDTLESLKAVINKKRQ